MKRILAMGLALAAVSAFASAPTAQEVMNAAYARARAEKKQVFVAFHASWCGWCKKLDAFMEQPDMKPLFEKSYVIVHLDVMESGDKTSLENAGAEEMMDAWGGKGQGIPFIVILDAKGNKLVDSRAKSDDKLMNIGHPVKKEEVDHFMMMLRTTAKRSSAADLGKIEAALRAQKQ